MKIVFASDSFKGSLTSRQANEAMAEGARRAVFFAGKKGALPPGRTGRRAPRRERGRNAAKKRSAEKRKNSFKSEADRL